MSHLYIFDLGGVLIKNFHTLPEMSKIMGLPFEVLEKDWELYARPLMEGYMSTNDYYDHLFTHFGYKCEGDFFHDTFHPTRNEVMIDIAGKLKAKGNVTAIGSNTFAPHWHIIDTLDIRKNFTTCYASHEMHLIKPDKEFWQYIMAKEGFTSENTTFVDDYVENIEGAASLGIETFRYTGDDKALLEFFKDRI